MTLLRLDDFPFIPLRAARLALRLAVAAVFFGHAAMRLWTPHHMQHLAELFASRGLPAGAALAWAATVFSLVASPLLVIDRGTRWISAGFLLISLASMAAVQSRHGWWVAEYGDGGMEFSFVLCAVCVYLIAAAGGGGRSLALPFPSLAQGEFVLRLGLALFFMIHAATRFTEADYFKGLGLGLGQFGMPFAYQLGLMATTIELVGGSLLIANRFARWVALGLFGISTVGILYIHLKFGWFVGEFGSGGAEFSVLLCAVCLVVAATDAAARRKSAAGSPVGSVMGARALLGKRS
jgi:putative oxidoreductase